MSKKKPDGYLEISQEAWEKAEKEAQKEKIDWKTIPLDDLFPDQYPTEKEPLTIYTSLENIPRYKKVLQPYLLSDENDTHECCPDSSQKGEVKSFQVIPVEQPNSHGESKGYEGLKQILDNSRHLDLQYDIEKDKYVIVK